MKDVENLFQRLGTRSGYQDFGSKMLDDVRGKWPLLSDVSEAEKNRASSLGVSASQVEGSLAPAAPSADTAALKNPAVATTWQAPSEPVQQPEPAVVEDKLPVRAFVSRKPQPASSARDIFKSIGKSNRLMPADSPQAGAASTSNNPPKGKSLFANNRLKDGNKT